MIIINSPQLHKQEAENERQYIYRICQMHDDKSIYKYDEFTPVDWNDLAKLFNSQLREDGIEWTESTYRKRYKEAVEWYKDVFQYMKNEDVISELDVKRFELQKERYKIQTEKLELNRWIREDARDELIWEKIENSIKNLKPLEVPKIKITEKAKEVSGVAMISDEHYGVDFVINGLEYGEVLNSYNPEEYEKRMWKLFNEIIAKCEKENLNQIKLFSLGDTLDGILHLSQLMTLRCGVVDSAIAYGEFVSNWLNELSKYLKIDYFSTYGNHTMLRLLTGKKQDFPNENMQKIIDKIIEIRLIENANVIINKNNTNCIYTNVQGFNILGVHGEEKSAEKALKDYSSMYNKEINYMAFGHKHHPCSESVGFCKGTIGVGSIMGTNDFAMTIKAVSDPSATFCLFEKGYGKVEERLFKLR